MKPAITIYIDRDNQFVLGFVEVSSAEDQAMKDHGAETNTAERDTIITP